MNCPSLAAASTSAQVLKPSIWRGLSHAAAQAEEAKARAIVTESSHFMGFLPPYCHAARCRCEEVQPTSDLDRPFATSPSNCLRFRLPTHAGAMLAVVKAALRRLRRSTAGGRAVCHYGHKAAVGRCRPRRAFIAAMS